MSQAGCFDEHYADRVLYDMIVQQAAIFSPRDALKEIRFAAGMYTLLSWLFDGHYHETAKTRSEHRVRFMKNVAQYLADNYTQDISTEDIARALYMTIPSFCGIFKRNYGTSFLNYLCVYRITRAVERYNDECSLKELAASVGFADYCYFSRSFRRRMGQAPATYFGRRKGE